MRRTLAPFLVVCIAAPAYAGGLAIVGTELRDNGDHDGYADTNETVELWLTVRNTTAQPLTGVTASLSLVGAGTVCIDDGTASIGTISPGATIVAADPFVFHVGVGQDRTLLGLTPTGTLTATFDVAVTAGPANPTAYPSRIVFDLDLDAPGGGAPTTIVEGFESGGFGLFSVQNLDFGRHDAANPELGAADGYRCQYHEPYCNQAVCDFSETVPGATSAAADAIWWRIDGPSTPGGGRGYSGGHALYFGEPQGTPLGYTTPAGVLEAVATTGPIHLASGRRCSNAVTTACVSDAGCPPGGSCGEVVPTLSIKHQMSFVDYRSIGNMDPGTCVDRGIVSMQLADASGAPVGPWMRLEPSTNVHDQVPFTGFVNATFDPVDDGNTGDDLYPPFEPTDLSLRRGPSSTCADERVFAWMGSTTGAFDPLGVGGADGPGLQGASGPGTWVETIYNLSRYRGRSVRIRFVASTTRLGSFLTMQALFGSNNVPWDDGWWIDDVTIHGATAAAGGVASDTRDNSALTLDADADGADDTCDDNCVGLANANQADFDADFMGDACDTCTDGDGDGFGNPGYPPNTCAQDNCPSVANASQDDADLDGTGEACDNCPGLANADQANLDADPMGDPCDCAPTQGNTYSHAPESNDGLDNQCFGEDGFGTVDEITGTIGFFTAHDNERLMWPPQPLATSYRVAKLTGTSLATVTCTHTTVPESFILVSNPPLGRVTFLLVRAQQPHVGSWGTTSAGVPRTVSCAP